MKLGAKIGIGVGIAVIVGGLMYANLRTQSAAAGAPATSGPSVNVVKVQLASMRVVVLAPATLEATQDTDVRSAISSTSVKLLVKAGEQVQAGQVLARLDTADLQQQLLQQRSALGQAVAQLAQLQRQQSDGDTQAGQQVSSSANDLATAQAALASTQQSLQQQLDTLRQSIDQTQRDLAALQQLPAAANADEAQRQADQTAAVQQKLASLQNQAAVLAAPNNPTLVQAQLRVDGAQAALKRARDQQGRAAVLPEQLAAAQQAVTSAQAAVTRLEQQVAMGEIKSPFGGMVLTVDVKDGQPVQTGARLLELGALDKVLAKIRVDEVDVGRVAPAQTVTVRNVAYPDETFTGQVTNVAAQALPGNGGAAAFEVQAEVANPGGKLRAGMSGDTEIRVAQHDQALSVGLETLVEENKVDYLWVVRSGVVHKVQVQVGLRSKTQAEIASGLTAGDQVVVGPFATMKALKDGMAVNPTVLQPKEGVGQ